MKQIDVNGVEEYREYVFVDYVYTIESPVTIYVSDSGSHRILDSEGITHHVSDWVAIRWKGDIVA